MACSCMNGSANDSMNDGMLWANGQLNVTELHVLGSTLIWKLGDSQPVSICLYSVIDESVCERKQKKTRLKKQLWEPNVLPAVMIKSFSVQFSSVPWPTGSSGGQEGRFSRDPLPVFFCGRPFWAVLAWAGMSTLDVVHPAFPLPTTVSTNLHFALKNGFGEVVLECDMPETC